MIKTSFSLSRPDSTTETAVILRCQCIDGRLKYYTAISIHPDKWSKRSKGLNARLARLKRAVIDYEEKCNLAGIGVTRAGLQEELKKLEGKKNKVAASESTPLNLFDRWRQIIEQMKDGQILTPRKDRYAPGTIRGMKFHIDKLEKFSSNMVLEDANMTEYGNFILWCQGKGMSKNYIGTIIKNWKTLCHHCGLSVPRDFKRLAEDATTIALSESEIYSIYTQETPLRRYLNL